MEQIWGKNCNKLFSVAPYLVQNDQGHLVTSSFLPQGHRTRYKIIRGILDPDHPPKFRQWPWDTGHWCEKTPLFMGPCVFFVFGKHAVNGLDFHSLSAFECLTMGMIVTIMILSARVMIVYGINTGRQNINWHFVQDISSWVKPILPHWFGYATFTRQVLPAYELATL